MTQVEFIAVCKSAGVKNMRIEYTVRKDPFIHQVDLAHTELLEIAWMYYRWSSIDLKDLHHDYYNKDYRSYPDSNLSALIEEMPSSYMPGKDYPASISTYALWVRYSGLHG